MHGLAAAVHPGQAWFLEANRALLIATCVSHPELRGKGHAVGRRRYLTRQTPLQPQSLGLRLLLHHPIGGLMLQLPLGPFLPFLSSVSGHDAPERHDEPVELIYAASRGPPPTRTEPYD